MKQHFDRLMQTLQRQKGQVELLQSSVSRAEAVLQNLEGVLSLERETLRLMQLSSAATWDTTKQLVESLVTRALQAVFYDRDYKFIVKQEVKRGASAVSFAVLDEGMELDLIDELGGGIADVVALVLRIAFLVLHKPKIRPALFLDEPLKHLWSGYQPNAAKFLKQVCQELELQLLVVTHQDELAAGADQIFRIRKANSSCQVSEEPL